VNNEIAQTKQLNFSGSRLTGLNAGLARINGNFWLTGCECRGQLLLTGTRSPAPCCCRTPRSTTRATPPCSATGCLSKTT
jgi:hypothetical protein